MNESFFFLTTLFNLCLLLTASCQPKMTASQLLEAELTKKLTSSPIPSPGI